MTLLSGPAARGKDACLKQAENAINAWSVPYSPFGPNSNTAAVTMCALCGIPVMFPEGSNPYGWDARMPPEPPLDPIPGPI